MNEAIDTIWNRTIDTLQEVIDELALVDRYFLKLKYPNNSTRCLKILQREYEEHVGWSGFSAWD